MHGALEQEELVRTAVRDGRGQLGRLVHEEHAAEPTAPMKMPEMAAKTR